MLRNPVPPLILLATLIALAAAFVSFQRTVVPNALATHRVLYSASDIRLDMKVRYSRGPLVEEEYSMSDKDGVSASQYRGVGRGGSQITVKERPRATIEDGPNVAFFFGKTVQDGIWELGSKPPRGDTSTSYRITVYQLTGDQHGTHGFAFTDPGYWATTGGHQFHLKLSKDKPIPDLLQLSSTVLVEPRYQKLVDDFRTFGPLSFRKDVASAQTCLALPNKAGCRG